MKILGEVLRPVPIPESLSNTEELVIHVGVVTLAVMAMVRLIVKDGCDLYDDMQRKRKRWRRRAP